jgi:ATP-dependent Clp protease protease subunit
MQDQFNHKVGGLYVPQSYASNQNSGPEDFVVPMIIENDGRSRDSYDVFSRLLKDRVILLDTQVNEQTASLIVAQMLFLNQADPKRKIDFYIDSPGGSVYHGLAIYDTMQFLTCDVETFCLGHAASMGAVLLAGGTKRHATPNARIMIHQVSGGAEGKFTDVERTVEEMKELKQRLNEILAFHTKQPFGKVWADCEHDYWMSAKEAKKYGLIDEVIKTKKGYTPEEEALPAPTQQPG